MKNQTDLRPDIDEVLETLTKSKSQFNPNESQTTLDLDEVSSLKMNSQDQGL